MNSGALFTVFSLICSIFLAAKAQAFCDLSSESLPADLTRSVVRSSDWLKKTYGDKSTVLRPYRAGSLFASLRIAGHYPDVLLSDFKDGQGVSIEETLKNELDSVQKKYGNLSSIPTPQLALITQGVISICNNPADFHGYELIQTLLDGFAKFKIQPDFNNYFGYSLAVIALCNADHFVPDAVILGLIKGAQGGATVNSVDINALLLTALSCVKSSSSFVQQLVSKTSRNLVRILISKQSKDTGAFGNQYSTALAVEALQAARVSTKRYRCEKAMRSILTYQKNDGDGSFGSILANIQVTPALLGESLISLKKYPCPKGPTPAPQEITVHVRLVFDVPSIARTVPEVSVKLAKGATAYVVLELAKLKNSCYTATYKKYSFGRSVTSICGVSSDWKQKQYWMIAINGKASKYGVDSIKPKDGDLITFKYVKLSF
ncbi:transcobalamin-2-like [Dendronephthya gigantea]|uniref:transcobalamin-2-like n=1 Tax=Dendronephthya gigantea TaxID=151771 RepID=UPI001068E6D8|nr:transcobalamin-2-like [Dendronephthya gigantea]